MGNGLSNFVDNDLVTNRFVPVQSQLPSRRASLVSGINSLASTNYKKCGSVMSEPVRRAYRTNPAFVRVFGMPNDSTINEQDNFSSQQSQADWDSDDLELPDSPILDKSYKKLYNLKDYYTQLSPNSVLLLVYESSLKNKLAEGLLENEIYSPMRDMIKEAIWGPNDVNKDYRQYKESKVYQLTATSFKPVGNGLPMRNLQVSKSLSNPPRLELIKRPEMNESRQSLNSLPASPAFKPLRGSRSRTNVTDLDSVYNRCESSEALKKTIDGSQEEISIKTVINTPPLPFKSSYSVTKSKYKELHLPTIPHQIDIPVETDLDTTEGPVLNTFGITYGDIAVEIFCRNFIHDVVPKFKDMRRMSIKSYLEKSIGKPKKTLQQVLEELSQPSKQELEKFNRLQIEVPKFQEPPYPLNKRFPKSVRVYIEQVKQFEEEKKQAIDYIATKTLTAVNPTDTTI